MSEGRLGLLRAVDKFDPGQGLRLSTVGFWWIRQAIQHATADQARTVRLPRSQQAVLRKVLVSCILDFWLASGFLAPQSAGVIHSIIQPALACPGADGSACLWRPSALVAHSSGLHCTMLARASDLGSRCKQGLFGQQVRLQAWPRPYCSLQR